MLCTSSTVLNTRPTPPRRDSSAVTLYTPPLRATSSPNTISSGYFASRSPSARLMWTARWLGRSCSGNLPSHSAARGRDHRIGGLVGLDLGQRAIALLDVRPGVAEQPHRAQVEERRPSRSPHVLD